MPCPFFEPRFVAAAATLQNGRLPLIDEYDGRCHLRPALDAVDSTVRLSGCNHGNLTGECSHLNSHFTNPQNRRPILRFNLQSREPGAVRVLLIEEQDFAPVRWDTVTFRPVAGAFEPEIEDVCRRAQLLAFCHSYLARFPL